MCNGHETRHTRIECEMVWRASWSMTRGCVSRPHDPDSQALTRQVRGDQLRKAIPLIVLHRALAQHRFDPIE